MIKFQFVHRTDTGEAKAELAWANFVRAVHQVTKKPNSTWVLLQTRLREYGCAKIDGDFLVFEDEQNLSHFLLRWS
jgi:hypothetical protein